jgi:hypothetical protein
MHYVLFSYELDGKHVHSRTYKSEETARAAVQHWHKLRASRGLSDPVPTWLSGDGFLVARSGEFTWAVVPVAIPRF